MDISISKRRILDEALKLFAVNGYEATSIEQITNAVGIRKSSLYSHFKSKKEILDLLVDEIKEHYQLYSERMLKDFEMTEENFKEDIKWNEEYIFKSAISQFEFLISDPFFSKVRNFLAIEQFRNPSLASLKNQCEYVDALNYYKKMIQFLVEKGIFIDKGIEIMAYEFFSPICVQFYHIQREPDCKDKALKIVEEHIKHFFAIYSR